MYFRSENYASHAKTCPSFHQSVSPLTILTYLHAASSGSCSGLELQDPVSISNDIKTSYLKISQILETTRFVFRIVRLLWNLTVTQAKIIDNSHLQFSSNSHAIIDEIFRNAPAILTYNSQTILTRQFSSNSHPILIQFSPTILIQFSPDNSHLTILIQFSPDNSHPILTYNSHSILINTAQSILTNNAQRIFS